jgi:hypothetical protein
MLRALGWQGNRRNNPRRETSKDGNPIDSNQGDGNPGDVNPGADDRDPSADGPHLADFC